MMNYRASAVLLAALTVFLMQASRASAQKLLNDSNLGTKWTHVLAVSDVSGRPCILAYNSATGASRLDVMAYAGGDYGSPVTSTGLTNVWIGNGVPGFTHFSSFAWNDGPFYIAYNSATGAASFNQVSPNCKGSAVVWSSNSWSKGWTHVMPFHMNGTTCFVLYNSTTGWAEFNKINLNQEQVPMGVTLVSGSLFGAVNLGKGWTHLMPFVINGESYFMLYNSATGLAEFNKINAGAMGSKQIGGGGLLNGAAVLGKGWTHLASSPAGSVFIVYNSKTGQVNLASVNADAHSFTVYKTTNWTTFANSISPFSLKISMDIGAHVQLPGFVTYTVSSGEAKLWLF